MKTVYFSLGSNLGDRAAQIARAVEGMEAAGVRPLRQSSIYVTEPVGGIERSLFLNCVLRAETDRMPLELLHAALRVEWTLGRRRMARPGPRPIDIDILFYGSSVIHTPELVVPHPRIAERRFVLVPLNEIAPDLRHPVLERTMAALLAATTDRGMVRPWRPAGS